MFNTNDDAKLALTSGQVDAIVVDLPTAFFITSAELDDGRSWGSCRSAAAPPSSSARCSTRTARSPACVSAAVDRLRADGTLAGLESEWLASTGTAPELR